MTSDPAIFWGYSFPPHNLITYCSESVARAGAATPGGKLWKRTETITLEEIDPAENNSLTSPANSAP